MTLPFFRTLGLRTSLSLLMGTAALCWSALAQAQNQPPPPAPGTYGGNGTFGTNGTYGGTYGTGAPGQPAPYSPRPRSAKRTDLEIGVLYGTSVPYGIGMGVWLSSEIGISDPGVFLIAPAVLGLAAPVGVYFLDRPDMDEGMPAAISLGLMVGAGEGLGIAGYQFASAKEADSWGFLGLARAMALGSTLGGVGGYALAYYEEPSPKSSAFIGSGVMWGTLAGSMFGYGASKAGVGYGAANDDASLGGLIGFNVGLAATGALSSFYYPSWGELGWMWVGAGAGAAISLPVFLFYADEGGPPAKRGFLFMGTATLLGVGAGALLGQGAGDDFGALTSPAFAFHLDYVTPTFMGSTPGTAGSSKNDQGAGFMAGGRF